MEPETWIANTDEGQALITITADKVFVAFRRFTGDTWGIPYSATKA